MRPDDVARLKTLEQENVELKRLLAERELDNDMLGINVGMIEWRENGNPKPKTGGRVSLITR